MGRALVYGGVVWPWLCGSHAKWGKQLCRTNVARAQLIERGRSGDPSRRPACLSPYLHSRISWPQSHRPTLAPCPPPPPFIVANPARLPRVLRRLIHPHFLASFAPTMLRAAPPRSPSAPLGQMSRASLLFRLLPHVLDEPAQVH